MITQELRELVRAAVDRAVAAGDLPPIPDPMPSFEVAPPRDPRHGDYATNVALVLAKQVGRPARDVAAIVLRHLGVPSEMIARAELAGPGFVNLFVAPAVIHR
ncbi:MAG TPA: arginine--tRNA ligase, partial [bacterium]|nr:arginine--tRNA ligase [bacterium]